MRFRWRRVALTIITGEFFKVFFVGTQSLLVGSRSFFVRTWICFSIKFLSSDEKLLAKKSSDKQKCLYHLPNSRKISFENSKKVFFALQFAAVYLFTPEQVQEKKETKSDKVSEPKYEAVVDDQKIKIENGVIEISKNHDNHETCQITHKDAQRLWLDFMHTAVAR